MKNGGLWKININLIGIYLRSCLKKTLLAEPTRQRSAEMTDKMNEKWGIMEDKYKPNWYIPKVMSQENTPCWTYEATKITDKINEKRGVMED